MISYVDGFNLYFGLRSKGWRRYYWLDLVALTQACLQPEQAFTGCHYFTARIRQQSNSQSQSAQRQSIWLDALDTCSGVTCHFGHYLPKQQRCRSCGVTWISYEEKMTDVNIASQLLVDAYDDHYDTALIVSGDSDLTTPVRQVRERFPGKRLIIAFPPGRRSEELKKAAHGHFVIGADKLRNSLLPDSITTSSGFILRRPKEWC